jgi:hypothetical protein
MFRGIVKPYKFLSAVNTPGSLPGKRYFLALMEDHPSVNN